jgi:glycosyltransferase involved in cell wall biosynthesis
MVKLLFVANTGWYLYNFRLPLARFLRSHGVEVVMISPYDQYVERLQSEGFRWVKFGLNRRSVNPFRELVTIWELLRLYRAEKPAAAHHFTAKCIIYGTIAAKLTGVRAVVNALTGLGPLFMGTGYRAKITRPLVHWLYRKILSARRVRVVFQNPDDLNAFLDSELVVPDRTVLIRSSGVNLKRFSPRQSPLDGPPAPIVLFAGRLTQEKGVLQFVEAARILKSRGTEAIFQIAGTLDPGNASSVDQKTLDSWRIEGAVDLLGHVDPIDDVLAQASIVVLPSYREGVPRILLEAGAMGKPVVATDVPGCREAVAHGQNGLLVPPGDSEAPASAIYCLLADPRLRYAMGRDGREKVMREFSEEAVALSTMDVYHKMGLLPQPQAEQRIAA